MTELDPAHLDAEGLAEHVALEQEGGWGPPHLVLPTGRVSDTMVDWLTGEPAELVEALCERYAGAGPGDVYAMTSDREIFDRWHAVGWGCRACAEVLHS